ncbi:MAG: HAMP domain-containing sensor histidine kinase [Pseudomonadota bacterium]|nr:HAMP domain-containing sensor histidine kinase [Pseudomonadota bacterium]
MDTEQIRHQQAVGYGYLRFEPALEGPYRLARAALIRQRARPVSIAGLLLFLVYAGMDLLTLPPDLARVTVSIRLAITCPVIAIVVWLAYRPTPSDRVFEHIYLAAYLLGGLCVVAIIGVARSMAFPLPYEGMILMLMFGYFAMGLPFLSASLVSWVLVASYLVVELWTGQPSGDLLINLFFLTTANVIGMIGAWTSEYRHRAHFLDRQLLKQLHQAARHESQRKTELITAASHDLRQPLNVIDITLQTMTAGPDSIAEQLRDRVRHLRRLLGTVFDSARLNEGMIKAELQPVCLAGLYRDLEDLVADSQGADGMELRVHHETGQHQILADPDLLFRVLQNLMFNALDHSGGQRVSLRASADAGHVLIEVSDDGRGLPPELEDSLFLPYVRGHGSCDCPGLGLGLTIVREFTTLMNGSCGARSRPEGGATFWIRLPVVTASPARGQDSRIPSGYAPPVG